MARPRAADDFRAIRARMEELRRERDDVGSQNDRPAARSPYRANGRDGMADKSGLATSSIQRITSASSLPGSAACAAIRRDWRCASVEGALPVPLHINPHEMATPSYTY